MGMVVLLLPARVEDLSLGPEAASRLSELGISYAALLRDHEGTALLLDGRSFDPDRSADAALRAVGAGGPARTLHPLAQMSVRSSA